jgi:branched-subunit amino acid transport protein AzlD
MTMSGISTTRKRLMTTISIMVVLLASRCLQFLIAGTDDPLHNIQTLTKRLITTMNIMVVLLASQAQMICCAKNE